MNRFGVFRATAVALLATVALAWWIKGDWEMGWLFWMPVAPVAGAVVGLVAALAFRAPLPLPVVAGAFAGGLALWGAMATPNRWTGPERGSAERLAQATADLIARVETRAREILHAGVEVAGARPSVRGGWAHKRPFALLPEREPILVRVDVDFALGPARPLALRLEGDTLVALQEVLDSVRAAPWVIRPAALERRFDSPALSVGGPGPWPQGAVVPIRLERGESDWTLLLVRVGGADGLETVREITRAESRAALGRAAAGAGRGVRDVRIYFAPRGGGVTYQPTGRFDFVGLRADGLAPLRLIAGLDGDAFVYSVGSWR